MDYKTSTIFRGFPKACCKGATDFRVITKAYRRGAGTSLAGQLGSCSPDLYFGIFCRCDLI